MSFKYKKRIVLIGAECTGKTKLCKQLAKEFKTSWAPEFARKYAETKKLPLTKKDVPPIAKETLSTIHNAEKRAKKIYFCDTDLLQTVVYSYFYYQCCPIWIEKKMKIEAADLYLLLEANLPWQKDPVRGKKKEQKKLQALLKKKLKENNFPFCRIIKIGEERFLEAKKIVKQFMMRK